MDQSRAIWGEEGGDGGDGRGPSGAQAPWGRRQRHGADPNRSTNDWEKFDESSSDLRQWGWAPPEEQDAHMFHGKCHRGHVPGDGV